jgi:hypothetical protein
LAQPSRPPITGVINHISWGIEPWDRERVRSELVKRGLSPQEDTGGHGTIETSRLEISNQTKEKHDLTGPMA